VKSASNETDRNPAIRTLDLDGFASAAGADLDQLELLPAAGYTPRPLTDHRWRAWGGRTGAELIVLRPELDWPQG
jgi:hypothetical protein